MSNNYIVLSGIHNDIHFSRNTYLLTNGCTLDYKYKKYLCKVNIANDNVAEIYREKSLKLSNYIIPYISEIVSKSYGIKNDYKFWFRLLHPWTLHFIQALIIRYLYIRKSLTILKKPIFLTDTDNILYTTSWRDSSYSLYTSDQYNLHLFSDIVRFYKLESKQIFTTTKNKIEKIQFGNTITNKYNLILNELYNNANRSKKPAHVLYQCYGIPDWHLILKKGYPRLTLAGNYNNFFSAPNLNTNLRNKTINIQCHDDFSQLLASIVLRYLPITYCEGLPGLLEAANSIKLPHKGVIATSVSHFTDPLFTVLYASSDRPFVVIEHGGGQMYRHFPSYDLSNPITDRYYDWGKCSKYYLPNPYLTKINIRKKRSPPILIGGCFWRFPSLFHSANSIDIYNYLSNRLLFLRLIDSKNRPVIRLYNRELGWAERTPLEHDIPGLYYQNASEIPIEQAMADTILLIHDHYSTTFHRAMASNIPSIIFTIPCSYSEQAKTTISNLRDCGVWHDTAVSAANFYISLIKKTQTLQEAENNIQDWWQSVPVRKAREIFCIKYAQTDINWANSWQDTFDKLC